LRVLKNETQRLAGRASLSPGKNASGGGLEL
jgi:hypothetical protein